MATGEDGPLKKKSRKLPGWMKDKVLHSGKTTAATTGSLLSEKQLVFSGSIIYSYNECDCALLCDDILTSLETESGNEELYVGFDMEWPVSYKAGSENKTALIQVATSLSKCYLFHISCMPGLPGPLRDLINDKRVKKIGVGIESDIWKLARDFDGIEASAVIKQSIINLSVMANSVLGCKENWSLDGLLRHVLHLRLEKESGVRTSAWNVYPLIGAQQQYAATDAHACLLLYHELKKRKG